MLRRALPLLTLLCFALAGCGSKPSAHAAAAPSPTAQQPQAVAEPPEDDTPPVTHDPFEQPDDVPMDPKAVLQEMRHDCCTELPAAEIEQHREPQTTK